MSFITDKITLYISTDEFDLKKRGDNFLLYKDEEKVKSIPAIKIKDLVIAGDINLTSGLINLCKQEKINIHFISRSGKYYGSLIFDPAKNIFVRIEQFKKHFDEEESNKIAINLVRTKISNQKWFLDSFKKKIDFQLPNYEEYSEYNSILGLEGSKSREYFSYWDVLIKNPDFTFIKRTKNPPENEINALLSLSYTILMNEIHTLCNVVNLDPYIGYLHKNYYGRPSLVCDLVEAYRPFIDKFVINLINRKEINKNHFCKNKNEIEYELTKDSFSHFIKKWTEFFKKTDFYYGVSGKKLSLYKIIENDVRLFSKYLTNEIEDFQQYTMG